MNRALQGFRCLNASILFNNSNKTMSCRSISSSQAVYGGFARDFKPGPYPTTEAERAAAAAKYGLKPEDYKPFPDDGMGYGDYPNLPATSPDMKSDWENWDDPYLKRNFGEPYTILQEQLTADKVSLKPTLVSFPKILFWFFFGSFCYIGLNWLTWDFKAFIPIAPKQYPRNVGEAERHYKI